MSDIGKPERATQNRVVGLFRDQIVDEVADARLFGEERQKRLVVLQPGMM